MKEVYDFLKACGVYYLATIDGDRARVRPFGAIDLFDGKLYIQTGKVKNVSKQLHANPKIELCAFNGKNWIRVAATAVEDRRVEAKRHMLEQYLHLQATYSAEDENMEVFYLEDATATISSFTEPARVIRF